MNQPTPPTLLRLGDFYTAALWSGILAMGCASLLYAAFRVEGTPRLVLFCLGALLALISALTLLLRSWLEVDPENKQLRLRRGLVRPLWTARRWPLQALERVDLISDEPPAHHHLPYDQDDEGQPQELFISYYVRLTLDGMSLNLPAEESKPVALQQAQRMAALAQLPVTEGQQEEPGRRWRRWGLWLALGNALLVTAYALYAVSVVPPQPDSGRLRGGWAPEPYREPPTNSRPLTPRDRLRPGDRLWVQWKEGSWFAAEVLAAPNDQGVHIHFRGHPRREDQIVPLERARLPTRAQNKPTRE